MPIGAGGAACRVQWRPRGWGGACWVERPEQLAHICRLADKCICGLFLSSVFIIFLAWKDFPGGSACEESARNEGDLGSIPGLGRPLEKGTATHSSILLSWPGEFHGLCSRWGRKESDRTERLSLHLVGNPVSFKASGACPLRGLKHGGSSWQEGIRLQGGLDSAGLFSSLWD